MSCPICGCALLREFYRKEYHHMTICVECRHVSWQDMPSDGQIKEYYSREYTSSHNQFERQEFVREYYATHVHELAGYLGKPASEFQVVDVGCSYPIFLECAKKAGCNTIGVDWSLEAREYGQSVGIDIMTPPEFLQNIAPRSVDILRYAHTLEHMVDPLGVISTHVSKLKLGGIVYITQPNFPVFKAESCDIELLDSVWPEHLHFFNPISLGVMVDRCNVKLKRVYSVTDEVETEKRYRSIIDTVYAARRLEAFAPLGEPARGPLNNFPYYSGQNIGAYGVLE